MTAHSPHVFSMVGSGCVIGIKQLHEHFDDAQAYTRIGSRFGCEEGH